MSLSSPQFKVQVKEKHHIIHCADHFAEGREKEKKKSSVCVPVCVCVAALEATESL